MGEHVIKLPDVGEGVAEAELVEWHVKIGDLVREDAVLAAVMTDKATVEIPSPVDGEIVWLGAEIGDTVPVGSPIVRIKVAGDAPSTAEPAAESKPEAKAPEAAKASAEPAKKEEEKTPATPKPAATTAALKPVPRATTGLPRPEGERPLASPAVRLRAREAGIDLRQVPGTGPAGRVTHEDLDAFAARGAAVVVAGLQEKTGVEEVKVIGLRRRIAEKMALAKSRIPHITYVEEVDVTALEELRAKLNASKKPERAKLTILPFLMRALVKAVGEQPQLNAVYDDDAGIIHRHAGVHIGMAAQTPGGLMVPVVKHAEARDLWDCAAEVNRLAEAAKAGTATREELTGSTITITSLGAMGGVATTPVINYPEVAVVGVNKIMIRPMWDGTQFVPRKMMNLSSSFDHRVIDGWDAAVFVQRIKALLEAPAMIFVEG
ncbi:dihydrolipoamide acetyltransferase family protein [Aminobacter sp. NyZ550]|jgi:2-oxoisovalerate dehydrogenase E2 component (dihydrolipoyl transacylase)|uniref:dihydrolipoamide acetyltransferase family protein n=1 Tax=Aminobacter sp. NyZ550 TaxID=2979870 RepID=UPI0021D609F4|nr:dihydrolipoamide acetyltransferase family protein [Aminobacter sp. NyZ550]WAX96759.1 dihydrolipoamide acetyltransferase family protein [Aminobacter sp. NyZ550]